MRIYLQIPAIEDKEPRYYQLLVQKELIDGWSLIREWGKQGSPGRVKRDHFDTQDEAMQACLKVRDAQLKKGFMVVFMQGQGTE